MIKNENYDNLYRGISKMAWGYVFIFFHFNFGTLDILPDFVGYLLFLSAIGLLQEVEPELALLRPFGMVLVIYHIIEWLSQLLSIRWGDVSQFVSIVLCIVSIYFQFQMITNLATLAMKYQSEGAEFDRKLLIFRNVYVVGTTGTMILTYLSLWLGEIGTYLAFGCALVTLFVGIGILVTLFGLRKEFREDVL